MYFNGNITYNNVTSASLGLTVSSMPKVTHSGVKVEEYDVPFRDGIQYSSFRSRTDAQIVVKFAIIGTSNSNYISKLRAARTWLSGTGNLILASNSDVYYVVKKVEISNDEMLTIQAGELEATFIVEPFEYIINDSAIVFDDALTTETKRISNDGDLCKPLIEFDSESTVTPQNYTATFQIDSGSNIVFGTFNTLNKWYADTDKMFTCKYNSLSEITTMDEAKFQTGDYELLWLSHGSHDIKLVKNIYGLKVKIKLRRGYAI